MNLEGKVAYICSPLSADTEKQRLHNMDMARFYLERMKELYHCHTIASHAYLPLMLDDTIPKERETALKIGMMMMEVCDVLIICGRRVSSGMKGEIKMALKKGMTIYWYDSIMKPFELFQVKSWRDINDEVQIQK